MHDGSGLKVVELLEPNRKPARVPDGNRVRKSAETTCQHSDRMETNQALTFADTL